jgi:hypothetical protein
MIIKKIKQVGAGGPQLKTNVVGIADDDDEDMFRPKV